MFNQIQSPLDYSIISCISTTSSPVRNLNETTTWLKSPIIQYTVGSDFSFSSTPGINIFKKNSTNISLASTSTTSKWTRESFISSKIKNKKFDKNKASLNENLIEEIKSLEQKIDSEIANKKQLAENDCDRIKDQMTRDTNDQIDLLIANEKEQALILKDHVLENYKAKLDEFKPVEMQLNANFNAKDLKKMKKKSLKRLKEIEQLKFKFTYDKADDKTKKRKLNKSAVNYSNDDKYSGNVRDGLKNGYGIMNYSNDEKYKGYWLDDQQEGNGTLYYSNWSIKYEGNWKHGKYNGLGKEYYSDDSFYDGTWVNGTKSGNNGFHFNSYSINNDDMLMILK